MEEISMGKNHLRVLWPFDKILSRNQNVQFFKLSLTEREVFWGDILLFLVVACLETNISSINPNDVTLNGFLSNIVNQFCTFWKPDKSLSKGHYLQ